MAAINGDWLEALKDEFKKDYYTPSLQIWASPFVV